MNENKNKNKRECKFCDLIFHNRHCLAFITVLAFIFTYGMIADASEGFVGSNGSYTVSDNFRESMGIEAGTTPWLDCRSMFTQYTMNGGDTENLIIGGIESANYQSWRYDDTSPAGYKFPESVTVDGVTVTFPSTAYYFSAYAFNSASSQQFFYNCRVSGSGHFCAMTLTNNGDQLYIVSDQPFVFGATRYMAYYNSVYTVEIVNVDTPQQNGFYIYGPWSPSSCSLTNMPVYIASSDGFSGFTTFTTSETDFSFADNNFDFNNLRADGLVLDPNPPAPAPSTDGYEHNMYLSATEKMMQMNSSSYNGKFFPDTDRISIAYNSFISQNQDKYKVKITYSADLVGTAEAPNAFYSDYSFDEHFEVVKFIPLTDFVNGTYDVNMGTEFSKAPGTIGGVLSGATSNGVYRLMSNETQTSDFSSFLGMLGDKFGLGMPMTGDFWYYNYWSGDRSYFPAEFSWEDHDFKVKINLVYNYNLEEETSLGYYEKTYDILDWNSSQLNNNDLNTNYDPELDSDGNPIILPSDNGSSLAGGTTGSSGNQVTASGGSALAYIDKGAVQISVVTGGQNGFQLSAQGWTDYGNFYQTTANALKDLATGEGDFPQVVQNAGAWLPSPIWALVLAGVGTSICIGLWHGVRNH